MSETATIILWVSLIIGIQGLLLGLLHFGGNRDIQQRMAQLMEAWRQSRMDWERAHAESMALNRDHSVALRALLERTDRN